MKKIKLTNSLLMFCFLPFVFTNDKKIDLLFPDIDASFVNENKIEMQLEGFKSFKNNQLINTKKDSQLVWYSIGYPKILPNSFQFDSHFFSIEIALLTDEHKQHLKEEIERVYSINISIKQIKILPFVSFKCQIPITDEDDLTYLEHIIGNIISSKKQPLRVYFSSDIQSKTRIFLMNKINKVNESILITCSVELGLFKRDYDLNYSIKKQEEIKELNMMQNFDKTLNVIKQQFIEKQNQFELTVSKQINKTLDEVKTMANQFELNVYRQFNKTLNELNNKVNQLDRIFSDKQHQFELNAIRQKQKTGKFSNFQR